MRETALDVAVIGAGLAGLACAARLRRRGVERFAVVEQGPDVGNFWRGNYDRIRLHSPFHALPDDGGLRRRWGIFLRRDELLGYLEGYARRHELGPRLCFGERVVSLAKDGDGWRLRTSAREISARYAVVATSYNRIPRPALLPDAEKFGGRLLHSREYRNARPFRDRRVLVVGSGNSGAEIALDLAEGGAREVSLFVRGPRHVLSLRKLALLARVARLLRVEMTPKHLAANHRYTRTHPDWTQQLAQKDAFFSRLGIDLARFGIRRPDEGPATQMYRRGRIPWYDQGTAAAIEAGRIAVIDGNAHPIRGLVPEGVAFEGREEPFDAIVLATGLQPGLDEFLAEPERLLFHNPDMDRRMPRTDGRCRSAVEPSLFFPGFDLTVNGGLSLGLWGFEIADAIAAEL